MKTNKSLSNYHLAIQNCLEKQNYCILFYGKYSYFNDIMDLLINNNIEHSLNKSTMVVSFNNGSSMHFFKEIEIENLFGREFNMIFISDEEPLKDNILKRYKKW